MYEKVCVLKKWRRPFFVSSFCIYSASYIQHGSSYAHYHSNFLLKSLPAKGEKDDDSARRFFAFLVGKGTLSGKMDSFRYHYYCSCFALNLLDSSSPRWPFLGCEEQHEGLKERKKKTTVRHRKLWHQHTGEIFIKNLPHHQRTPVTIIINLWGMMIFL